MEVPSSMADDHPMISVDELHRCLLEVPDDAVAAELAHREEYEREARVLDEQMTREARAAVNKLKLHGYIDLGDLMSREEQTRANMWQQVVMGQGSDVEIYRNVCSSVIHIIMQKAMAMEPFVSQVVGEYICLLQRQHSLTALTSLPAASLPSQAPAPRAAGARVPPATAAGAAATPAPGRLSAAGVTVEGSKPKSTAHSGQHSDLDDSMPSSTTNGAMPSFRGSGAGTGTDPFNTSDTGSEFDPVSGSFVDKRQVRRERNKLAAKGYRQRKRMSVEAVEAELEDLRRQNQALAQQNTVLQTENGLLREQLDFFRKALSGSLTAGISHSQQHGAGR